VNTFKTFALMLLMTAIFIGVGYFFGPNGMILALVLAFVMNFITYWLSDKIVLAMYRAQHVERVEAPDLYAIVEELAQSAGMPMPKVYIIPSDHANAFATGRNPRHAAVAVTEGILRLMDRRELRAVLAHELAHVKHRDILTATVIACIAGAIMWAAMMLRWVAIFGGVGNDRDRRGGNPLALLLVSIIAPFVAMLVQLWISRTREYAADEGGARLSGDPLGLASALRKLESAARYRPLDANPATAHMFIVKPLSGRGLLSIFSTHPPIEDRVARLEALAARMR